MGIPLEFSKQPTMNGNLHISDSVSSRGLLSSITNKSYSTAITIMRGIVSYERANDDISSFRAIESSNFFTEESPLSLLPDGTIRQSTTKTTGTQILRDLLINLIFRSQIQESRRIITSKARWIAQSDRSLRRPISPITMCVEILNPMQSPSKAFNSRTFPPRKNMQMEFRKRKSTIENRNIDFLLHNPSIFVHNMVSRIESFTKSQSQVINTCLKLSRSLFSGLRVLFLQSEQFRIEEISIVAMGFWAFGNGIECIWGSNSAIEAPTHVSNWSALSGQLRQR
ncbi:hypothetical protein E6O75_ATG10053 [Venturia nashicola]|uniref:Uncharacterized protein n=1 Tax=Venturia nashicola TaxID=86259 RepID=A0A4Z1NRI8_9PEZI|nr:hypothetical protein E6O75_ATG10053 [Venturia nashicola]